MSDVTEIAEREASAAEAEHPDEVEGVPAEGDTPDAPDEPDDAPDETPDEPAEDVQPPAQMQSERDYELAMERLEKEAVRHAKRVAEIMGENGQALEPCPLCWTPGFVYPPEVPWITVERIAAVKLALGESPEPDYREAEDKQTCDECGGLTKTLTGAKLGEQVALPCRKCNGQGWIAKLHEAPTAPTQTDASAPAFPAPPSGTADMWGRPAGHPHWGMAPASVGT